MKAVMTCSLIILGFLPLVAGAYSSSSSYAVEDEQVAPDIQAVFSANYTIAPPICPPPTPENSEEEHVSYPSAGGTEDPEVHPVVVNKQPDTTTKIEVEVDSKKVEKIEKESETLSFAPFIELPKGEMEQLQTPTSISPTRVLSSKRVQEKIESEPTHLAAPIEVVPFVAPSMLTTSLIPDKDLLLICTEWHIPWWLIVAIPLTIGGYIPARKKSRRTRYLWWSAIIVEPILLILFSYGCAGNLFPYAYAIDNDTTPDIIFYEGRLLDNAGSPVTAPQEFRVSLWSDGNFEAGIDQDGSGSIPGGAPGFSGFQELHTITPLANGYFSIRIGSIAPLPVVTIESHRHLQVQIKPLGSPDTSYELLDPTGDAGADTDDRQEFGASPYAKVAERLDNREIGTAENDLALLGPDGAWLPSQLPDGNNHERLVLDADNTIETAGTGSINLQFGDTLNHALSYDVLNDWFHFDDDLDVTGNITVSGTVDGIDVSAVSPTTTEKSKLGELIDLGDTTITLGNKNISAIHDQNTDIGTDATSFKINTNADSTSTIAFGQTLGEYLRFNTVTGQFEMSDDFDITGNVIVTGTIDGVDVSLVAPTVGEKSKLEELVDSGDSDIVLGNKNISAIHDQNTDTGTTATSFNVNSGADSITTIDFGDTLGKYLRYNTVSNQFELNDDVSITGDIAVSGNVDGVDISAVAPTSGEKSKLGELVDGGDADISIGDKNISDIHEQNTDTGTNVPVFVINNAANTTATLQFGQTLGEYFRFNTVTDRFEISDDVDISGDLTISGTVDGVDVSAVAPTSGEKAKLEELVNAADTNITLGNKNISAIHDQNTDTGTDAASFNINSSADSTTTINFGNTLGEYIRFNTITDQFETSDDLDITGNIIITGTIDGVDVSVVAPTVGEKSKLGELVDTGDSNIALGDKNISAIHNQNTDSGTTATSFNINSSADSTTTIDFGDTLGKYLRYNTATGEFELNDDVNITGNIGVSGTVDGIDVSAVSPTSTEKSKLGELVNAADTDIALGNKNISAIHDQNTDTGTTATSFNINSIADSTTVLEFGQTLGEYLQFNTVTDRFEFSNDIDVAGNMIISGTVDGIDVSAIAPTVSEKSKLGELVNAADTDIALGNKNISAIHDQNTDTGSTANSFNINTDGDTTTTLLFGQTLGEYLRFNTISSQFELTDDLDVTGNIGVTGTVDGIDVSAVSPTSTEKAKLGELVDSGDSNIALGDKNISNIHVQNTDTGSSSTSFTLDTSNAGTGNSIDLIANQGSENDGTIRYNTSTNQWEASNNGAAFEKIDLELGVPTVQARRTTTLAIPTSFTDVDFDTTDTESQTSILDHDGTNRDRITIGQTGLYFITYSMSIDMGSTVIIGSQIDGRVRSNDTTVLNGSESVVVVGALNGAGGTVELSQSFISTLSSGSFISLQLLRTNTASTLRANAVWTIYQLRD